MAEENEGYQPVRIAPFSNCPTWVDDGFAWPVGSIVRVRPVERTYERLLHSNIHYQVHPEDDFEPKGKFLCEHQILAD